MKAGDLLERFQAHDWRALARAITIVENDGQEKPLVMRAAYRDAGKDCMVVGLTGAGGAGKSTLVDCLISVYREEGATVGVLAVDPSSPYTGGALLGDRLRMGRHSGDPGVFIRSFASRGELGGISQGAKDALYLYKAFGFDVILLESLGAGQGETDIRNFTDVTAVVLAPGNGDDIQLAKAGIQEIADIFVLNKMDRPGAGSLHLQLSAMLDLLPAERRPMLVRTAASKGRGIEELLSAIESAYARSEGTRGARERARIEDEIFSGALSRWKEAVKGQVGRLADRVSAGELTPQEAAALLGGQIRLGEPFGGGADEEER